MTYRERLVTLVSEPRGYAFAHKDARRSGEEMGKRLGAILIVDDHEPDVVYTTMLLEDSGLVDHIYDAPSAQQALDLFLDWERTRIQLPDKFPPWLILLDINMPGLNGFEFLEEYEKQVVPRLREAGQPSSVILMISSSTGRAERERAHSFASVRDFLSKPLTRERVSGLIERFGYDADPTCKGPSNGDAAQ